LPTQATEDDIAAPLSPDWSLATARIPALPAEATHPVALLPSELVLPPETPPCPVLLK
jgi:hypothetical protein